MGNSIVGIDYQLTLFFGHAVWVLGNMFPFFLLLKVCGLLRATADEEALGLDSSHHVSAALCCNFFALG